MENYGLKSDRDYLVDDIMKLKNYEKLKKIRVFQI